MDSERARRWYESRTFHHSEFPAKRLAAERTRSVSACVPARNEERTIGPIVADLVSLREAGAIDEVMVIDAGSHDSTPEIAADAGASVHVESDLLPEHGEVLGKGDAMWRALSVLDSDVIVFLDADSEGFGPHFATGLIGPLVCGDTGVEFVKAFYRRPLKVGEVSLPEGGGRVTELMARPLLNLLYPELAGFRQPLAGELAATRDLLLRFFFQAEDGIRDYKVTGVQTCALPIFTKDQAIDKNPMAKMRRMKPARLASTPIPAAIRGVAR